MPASVLAYPDVGLLPAADLRHLPWVPAMDSLCRGLQYTGCLAFSFGSSEEAAKEKPSICTGHAGQDQPPVPATH